MSLQDLLETTRPHATDGAGPTPDLGPKHLTGSPFRLHFSVQCRNRHH